MKNYEIDTKLLPQVWVTWMSSHGRIWMDNNGVRCKYPEPWMYYNGEHDITRWNRKGKYVFGVSYRTQNNDKLWVASGSQLYYAYAKYHDDIDRLEVAVVKYDTTRAEGKHTWYYAGDRLFIGKDKSVINQNGVVNPISFLIKKDDVMPSAHNALQAILRLNINDYFVEEFKKFLGSNYFVIGNGTSVSVSSGYHLSKWYASKSKTRSNGKTQKIVDELIKFPLNDIYDLGYFPMHYEERWGSEKCVPNVIYFERVNDKWSVLRGLIRDDNDEFEEAWRAYIGDDGTNQIATKSNDGWVPSSQPNAYNLRWDYHLANMNEAFEKCNRIKYIMPIFEETKSISALLTTLRFPIIEQLYKLGYKDMAKKIANSNTPKATIKTMFGGYYKEKEKGVLRQIGMTKPQLSSYYDLFKINRYSDGWCIKTVREILGDDLSHTDNLTYDKYLGATHRMQDIIWSRHYIDGLNVDKAKFWKNAIRLGEKNEATYRLLNDTISEYNRLRGARPEIDWIFDGYSDIVRVHDVLVELRLEQERAWRTHYSVAEAERLRRDEEVRKKTDEERKCYEYEDNDFIIRLPKDINEIINEGARQHICIGGYTSRHSKGDTNLFFLRKKNDETTPFYAIEMNNKKSIVQIHGFSNKWLGNNPEAITTVVRWLRKHNIKCDTTILTCTATGYSNTQTYITMPIVD